MDPEITVLMSVYNGERFLREAIESILNQTYREFEFLIINDGSTDSSREIILSYNDPRIRLIDNEPNIGLTRSLNKGLRLAKGEYIARMDADDISIQERLEKQFKFMEKRLDVGLVTSWYEVIDEKNSCISIINDERTFENMYYFFTFGNQFPHSSTFFRKKNVMDLDGYDERYKRSQDYDLWFRLSRVTRIEMISEVLLKWRKTDINISNMFKNEQTDFAKQIFITNLESILSNRLNLDEYIYLFNNFNGNITKNNLIKSINHLVEINKKVLYSINPVLKVDMFKLNREIEKNIYFRTIVAAGIIYKNASNFDFLYFIYRHPCKANLIKYFLKSKKFVS